MINDEILRLTAWRFAAAFVEACEKCQTMPTEHELELLAEYLAESVRAHYARRWTDEV